MVAETCHAPLITVNATIAAVVRPIGADPPTLLVDEADTLWGTRKQADNNEDLRGLLNAGHQRNRPMLHWDITSRTAEQLDTFAIGPAGPPRGSGAAAPPAAAIRAWPGCHAGWCGVIKIVGVPPRPWPVRLAPCGWPVMLPVVRREAWSADVARCRPGAARERHSVWACFSWRCLRDAPVSLVVATEACGAIPLLGATTAALVWANSPWLVSGVALDGQALLRAVGSPITLGFLTGLIAGNLLGIVGASLLAVRVGLGTLPRLATGQQLAGVGFTVALFVTDLAVNRAAQDQAKVGILVASAAAAALGWLRLHLPPHLPGRHPRASIDPSAGGAAAPQR